MNSRPAGFQVRLLADLLDFIILSTLISIVIFMIKGEYAYQWAQSFIWQISYTLYLTILPLVWRGYILGKRLLGIKVKQIDGEALTYKNMIMREVVGKFLLVYASLGISTIVSIFMINIREDKRALHDLISRTYVSYTK